MSNNKTRKMRKSKNKTRKSKKTLRNGKSKKTLRKNKMSGGKHCETLEKMNKELLELNTQLEFDKYPVPVGAKEYEERLPDFRHECKSRIASLESDIQKHKKNCKICNEVSQSINK
jgi:hypothetical protein